VTGLRVTQFGVTLRTGDPARQQVEARELGHRGADQAALGLPTEAEARRRSMAVVELP